MDNEETKTEEKSFNSVREMMEHNQQQIVKRKEAYYDKVIGSFHLTRTKLDILIIILLIILVLIFMSGSH